VFTFVVNASVLIHLARIGRFHLLKDVYSHICITSSVFAEVVERVKMGVTRLLFQNCRVITLRPP
jgi:predicted nucleic acid-binding protein